MSEELKAIDFLRAKTITYELSSEELHYSLILYNLIMNLQRENEKLKKQLENCYCNRTDCSGRIKDNKQYVSLMQKVESQKKEFIEYLEDKLNMCDGFLDTIKSDLEEVSYSGRTAGKTYIATQIMKNETGKKCFEDCLSKYKEIIGEKDEEI